MEGIARLKPGMNRELAEQDMRSIMRQIAKENPVTDYGQTVNVISFRSQITTDYRSTILTLLGAVAFVLLIATANVANLLLVKASSRTKEMAIRGTLGASRGRMMQQMIVESLLLGGLGAAAGLALAVAGIPTLLALIPVDLPLWMHFEIDGRVLWFALAVSLATSLLFGLVPALAGSRVDLTGSLKEGGRTGSTSGRRGLVRDALVVVEVALSLVLLTGAGLMIRSFLALSNQRIGFDAGNVLTFRMSSPDTKYPSGEKGRALVNSLREQMASLPGVVSVAAASFPPLVNTWGRSFTAEGHPMLSLQDAPMINHTVVTPGYFRTLGIPLIEGRDFTEADGRDPLVTIVDQALARQYWPGKSAIGKRVRFGPPEANEPWHIIVGVVGEVRNQTLLEPDRKSVYLPYGEFLWSGVSILMRTSGPPLPPGCGSSRPRERDRPRCRRERVSQYGADCGALDLAATLLHYVTAGVRDLGASAGSRRPPRRDELCGLPAHARTRNPDGAGRFGRRPATHGDAASARAHASRCGVGRRGCTGPDAHNTDAVVPGESL